MDNDKPINGTLFFISNSILSQHFMLNRCSLYAVKLSHTWAWNCHNCNHQQRKSKNILHIINVFWFYGIEYCTWQNLSIPPNNSLFDCDTNSLRCAHRGIRQSRVAGCRVRPPPYGAVVPYCYATELSAQLYNRDDSTGKATTFKNSIKHDKRTPRYTTNLKEIIKVK